MGQPVVSGAMTMCTMGLVPGSFNATPGGPIVEGKPVGTITDNVPYVNILPFGLCTSLSNPITAAQTSAALGVLTPGTCTPVLPAPWVPGEPTVVAGGKPVLTAPSTCMCAYGGTVSVSFPATTRTIAG